MNTMHPHFPTSQGEDMETEKLAALRDVYQLLRQTRSKKQTAQAGDQGGGGDERRQNESAQ